MILRSVVWLLLLLQPAFAADIALRTPFDYPARSGSTGRAVLVDDSTLLLIEVVNNQPDLSFVTLVRNAPPQPPGPQPPPGPTPQPATLSSLIWIEESEARQPSQAAALIDKSIREAISQRRISFRVVDVDVKDEKGETPSDLAALIDAAKSKGLPVVFGLDANGKTVIEAKVNTREDFESLLRRLGVAVVEQRKEPVGSSPPQSQSKPAQPQSSGSCASGSCPTTGRWLIRRR